MVVHIFHLKTFVIDLLVRQIILDSLVSGILVRCNLYYLYSDFFILCFFSCHFIFMHF